MSEPTTQLAEVLRSLPDESGVVWGPQTDHDFYEWEAAAILTALEAKGWTLARADALAEREALREALEYVANHDAHRMTGEGTADDPLHCDACRIARAALAETPKETR